MRQHKNKFGPIDRGRQALTCFLGNMRRMVIPKASLLPEGSSPYWAIGLMISLCVFVGCGPGTQEKNQPYAIKGVLNLSDWDFEKDGPVDLSGEYEFYWQQQLAPEDFSRANPPKKTGFIEVPANWNGQEINGTKLSGAGYATYRLTILLQDSLSAKLAFKFLDMGTAYTVFANGKKILSIGVAGQTPETTVPRYFPQVVDFSPDSNRIELIYQVSNFHHTRGGVWELIYLGTSAQIDKMRERRLTLDFFLFGSILIMGLYHLVLFIIRKNDLSSLFFALFCLLIAVQLLTTVERYLLHIFPGLNWELFVKVEYLPVYLAPPVLALFLYALFPLDCRKSVIASIMTIGFLFSAIVALVPVKIFSQTLLPNQLFITMSVGYGLSRLVICAVRKRDGAAIILLGFLLLSVTIINDILDSNCVIQTGHFVHLGLFFFIFSHAFALSLRYVKAFMTIDGQRLDLAKTNEALQTEIVEHKCTKDELSRKEWELVEFIDKASVGLYWVGPDGRILWANQTELDLLGYSREEYIGHHLAEFFVDKAVCDHLLCRFAQRKVQQDYEARLRCKDGSIKYLLINSNMRWRDGQFIHTQCFTRDITARKQAEERIRRLNAELEQRVTERTAELKRSNEDLQQFAYVASHDLQEPLRTVSSYVQLLERRYKGRLDVDADEFIGYTVDGANRMQALIKDLLVYSRVGTFGKPFAATDCENVLSEAMTNLQLMISASDAAVTHTPLPTIVADGIQLVQLFQNLISNAIKFRGEAPPRIHIAAEPRENEWLFSVRDNGIGIDPQYAERIFVIFQCLHTASTYPGTGIGLAICKKIVERHGGRIWVESQPGKGSSFYFIIRKLKEQA